MSNSVRLAIHGFGRTGRQAFRAIWTRHRDCLDLAAVGVRDREEVAAAAHLLQYDSNYGRFPGEVRANRDSLTVDGVPIRVVASPSLDGLPWAELGIDIVIEATGAYTRRAQAAGHLARGAAKVIIAAESPDADLTIVYGLNEAAYDPRRHDVVATESGPGNALALVVKVLDEHFGIENAVMTAVRAYTNQQKLLDSTDRDLRRARAAPVSIVPASSRAADGVSALLPQVAGRLTGYALHVPVATVSILELTAQLRSPQAAAAVNDAFREAAACPLGRVLAVSDQPLVSSDFIGDRHSAVVDASLTVAVGPLVKVGAWFDNEWGYSNRVAEVAVWLAQHFAHA